jgi:hypothetical protein
MKRDMRASHVATTLAAVTAGLTAAAAVRRRAGRRLAPTATAPADIVVPAVTDRDAVVLPFVRPATTAPVAERPAAPARCGDSGGRTKAGAPCAARATSGGRCHHHPIAA